MESLTVPTNGTSATATVNNFVALAKPFKDMWKVNNSKGGEHLSASPTWSDGMLSAYISLFEVCGEGFVFNGYKYIHEVGKNGQDYIRREPFCDNLISQDKIADVRARLKASWDARASYRLNNASTNDNYDIV